MVLPSNRKNRRNRRSSPFSSGGLLDELFQDMESYFFGNNSLARFGNTDICEKDGKLQYELELPGLPKDQIKIQAKDDQLVVTGEVEQEEEQENKNYISRGRRYGRFKRSLPLPEEIEDPENLKAKFESGILRIIAELGEKMDEEDAVEVEIE